MNEVDIINIKKIIESRKPINFENGGDEKVEDLNILETCELNKIVKEFEENKLNTITNKIKELSSYFFDKDPECNIIILTETWGDYDGGRDLYECDDPDSFGSLKIGKYNKWCNSFNFNKYKDNETVDKLYDLQKLIFNDLEITNGEDFWDDDDGVNCYWHGFIAINKNYDIISFICRDDNMMADCYKNGPNTIKELI